VKGGGRKRFSKEKDDRGSCELQHDRKEAPQIPLSKRPLLELDHVSEEEREEEIGRGWREEKSQENCWREKGSLSQALEN